MRSGAARVRMLPAVGFAIALAAGPVESATAARLPFLGTWAGGPTDCSEPFRFTATTYTAPGRAPMRIQTLVRDGSAYRLRFKDGYEIEVRPQGGNLSWTSRATGDGFELKRCPLRAERG